MNENRLKIIRDDLGNISQSELSEMTGIPMHKIRYAETSKAKISQEIAQIISEKLDYNRLWVLTGEGPKKKDDTPVNPTIQPDFSPDDFVFIRQVNGKISAGGGLMPDDSADIQCAFRRDWIKKRGGKPDNMSLIKVSGDSMEPTLLPGDLILVDHSRTTIAPHGGIYAISINHEIMIKRIQILFPQNKLRILSDNSHYAPIEADPDQVKINGKVIWFGRDMER